MPIDVTVTLSDRMVVALNRLNNANNVVRVNAGLPELTVPQYFKERTREWVENEMRKLSDDDNRSLLEIYNVMTPEDQTAVDVLFNKYR